MKSVLGWEQDGEVNLGCVVFAMSAVEAGFVDMQPEQSPCAQKGSDSLIFCCHHLEIHSKFEPGVSYFHFAQVLCAVHPCGKVR